VCLLLQVRAVFLICFTDTVGQPVFQKLHDNTRKRHTTRRESLLQLDNFLCELIMLRFMLRIIRLVMRLHQLLFGRKVPFCVGDQVEERLAENVFPFPRHHGRTQLISIPKQGLVLAVDFGVANTTFIFSLAQTHEFQIGGDSRMQ